MSFKGDCKDWIRFWDQLLVEVDGSAISKIIKFNYLLELVTWGNLEKTYLDYMEDGYDKANKILNDIYGKDIKSVLHFYNKLAGTVQTLNTTKKLDSAQCLVYTLMNKLGPMREIIAQQNDDLEDWDLEELMEDMRNTQ